MDGKKTQGRIEGNVRICMVLYIRFIVYRGEAGGEGVFRKLLRIKVRLASCKIRKLRGGGKREEGERIKDKG